MYINDADSPSLAKLFGPHGNTRKKVRKIQKFTFQTKLQKFFLKLSLGSKQSKSKLGMKNFRSKSQFNCVKYFLKGALKIVVGDIRICIERLFSTSQGVELIRINRCLFNPTRTICS